MLAGLTVVWKYSHTPAHAKEALPQWPTNSQITLSSSTPTLVMFAHPHCPCTRASVAELARIAAKCAGRFNGWVVFFKHEALDEGSEQSDTMREVKEIPGMRIVNDIDGELARQFNVATSGHTLLYDFTGKLLFSGGITSARGHAGDNLGESAIISLLTGEKNESSTTPVFGCPILEDSPSP